MFRIFLFSAELKNIAFIKHLSVGCHMFKVVCVHHSRSVLLVTLFTIYISIQYFAKSAHLSYLIKLRKKVSGIKIICRMREI